MPSVLESVTNLLAQGDTLSKLGGAIGADPSTTDRAVQSAAPVILGGMADRAEQPGGQRAITEMLDLSDRSPIPGPVVGSNSDDGVGSNMLDGLFGSNRATIVSSLASKVGVGSSVMSKLLPMLAPMVVGAVAKRRATDGLTEAATTNLLTGERDRLQRSGLLSSLPSMDAVGAADAGAAGVGAVGAAGAAGVGAVGAAGAAGVGAVGAAGAAGAGMLGGAKDRVGGAATSMTDKRPNLSTARPDVDLPNKPGGGFGWLKWLLPLVAIVLLAGFALSQCGDDSATGALGDIADEATETAGDAADTAGDAADDAADTAGDAADDAADTAGDAAGDAVEAITGAELQPDVDAALAAATTSDAITATVDDDGVVSLTGEAESEEASAAAESAVAAVEGVSSVDNQIVVATVEAEDAAEEEAVEEEAVEGEDAVEEEASEEAAAATGATINELLDLDPITFAVNSADITAEGQAVLASAVEFLEANPDVTVEIGGHTDSDGDDAFNQELSQNRAESVKAFLEGQGIAGDRMTPVGYGESEPTVDNDTPENKAINRRIEFTIL